MAKQVLPYLGQQRPPEQATDPPAIAGPAVTAKPQTVTHTLRASGDPRSQEITPHTWDERAATLRAATHAATASPVGRRLRDAELRSPAGVRRSIVLMTILGRCRAFEPHE